MLLIRSLERNPIRAPEADKISSLRALVRNLSRPPAGPGPEKAYAKRYSATCSGVRKSNFIIHEEHENEVCDEGHKTVACLCGGGVWNCLGDRRRRARVQPRR